MKLLKYSLILVLILLMLVGCSTNTKEEIKNGIDIYSSTTSLGGVNNNTDETVFSYTLNISNNNAFPYTINSVEPILSKEILDKLIDDNVVVEVNKPIESNGYIEVEGKIILDTKGMSKKEISKFTEQITEYKISMETVIDIRRKNLD